MLVVCLQHVPKLKLHFNRTIAKEKLYCVLNNFGFNEVQLNCDYFTILNFRRKCCNKKCNIKTK